MSKKMLRRYFIAGLVVWIPLVVTFWVIHFLFVTLDRTLSLLPINYRPDSWLGFHLPGLGVIFVLIILLLTGMFATNFVGRRFMLIGENFLGRIPLVRSVYNSVKQVMGTVFSPSGTSFRKVLLVQYPRLGMWTIAFQTNTAIACVQQHVAAELVTVFVPTTPNPTGGFMLMVAKQDTVELALSIDEALKLVISMGVITPTVATLSSSHAAVSISTENNSHIIKVNKDA